MTYRELFLMNRLIISQARLCVMALRRQNYDRGIRMFMDALNYIQKSTEMIIINSSKLQQDGIRIEPQQILEILSNLMKTQEQQDYILMADLLELTVLPFYIELQVALQENVNQITVRKGEEKNSLANVLEQEYVFNELYPNYWNKNMALLKECDSLLLQQIKNGLRKIEVVEGQELCFAMEGAKYFLEETQSGFVTLRIEKENKSLYMHSNKDAIEEAEIFTDTYMEVESESYHILGLGLAYHIGAISGRSLYAKEITVHEPDICVIIINMIVHDMTGSVDRHLTICYDPELVELSKKIAVNAQGFIIHHPSLRNIENEELRRSFERFFVTDNSYRNQREQLEINFQINNCEFEKHRDDGTIRVVDDFLDVMNGKTICILAAGPSLDNNIEQLLEYRRRRGDIFVLATGTVLYKLKQMNFCPDAVIFTDSNQRIFHQLRANREDKFPMLLLTTAYYEFIKRYQGTRYLIFQKEFKNAEKKAMESGYHLYQTGGSVSTTALDVAIQAKPQKIVFLGLDLAFTNNLAHASNTSNTIAADKEDLIPVNGYYGETVYADQKFIIYREWIEKRIQETDAKKIEIINATEGGAYLEGALHKTLREALED